MTAQMGPHLPAPLTVSCGRPAPIHGRERLAGLCAAFALLKSKSLALDFCSFSLLTS